MRALIGFAAAVLFAFDARPQPAEPPADSLPRGAADRARPAPLAEVEDLMPAVDVGNRTTIGAGSVPPGQAGPGGQTAPAGRATRGALGAGTAAAMDTLDLGTTSITGNRELPKVLYIVPWKKSDLGDLVGRPVNTLLDEVLAPIDPEVFERHLEYYETLYGDSEEE